MPANRQSIELNISAINACSLSVLQLSSENHSLSGDYRFLIHLKSPKDFNPDCLFRQKGYLKFWQGDHYHLIHGVITQYSVGEPIGLGDQFVSITLSSSLALWDPTPKSRVFLDQSIIERTQQILEENGWFKGSYRFLNIKTSFKESCILQYQESDINFILHELARNGLVYSFQQTEDEAVLVFFDPKSHNESLVAPHLPLECIEPKGMGNTDPCILSWTQKTTLNQTGTSTEIQATTTARGLIPGQVLNVLDRDQPSINGRYRIISIQHSGVQRAGFPEWGQIGTPLDYMNTIILTPIESPYKTVFHPKRSMTGIHTAIIESKGGEYPYLNKKGEYTVRFSFDHSDTPKGQASPPLSCLEPFAGNNFGFHFPLPAGTTVAITFREGDGCTPIISGALPNIRTPSPINNEELTRHRLRTLGENTLEIEELKDHEYIKLLTHQENNYLCLDAKKDKPGVTLASLKGALELSSGKNGLIEIQHNQTHHSLKNQTINVKGNREIKMETGKWMLSAKTITLKSFENFQLNLKKESKFYTADTFKIEANNHIKFNSTQNESKILNPSHGIQWQANQSLKMSSENGDIIFRQGDSYINMSNNGKLILKANKISLKARQLYIPSSMEGST